MATNNAVDSPLAGTTGTGNFVGSTSPTIVTPLIGQINDAVHNVSVMTFTAAASAVNFISAISNSTGSSPGFQFSGSDANVSSVFTNKGSGGFSFGNNLGGTVDDILTLSGATTAVNFVNITSALTTATPIISAQGSDANISLSLQGKGTGGVQVKGVTDGSAANSGYVGQLLSSIITFASSTSFTSTSVVNLTSLNLTAGDWDVWGNIGLRGTTVTQLSGGISTTTASQPNPEVQTFISPLATSAACQAPIPSITVSISSTTTYFLVIGGVGTGSMIMFGGLYARRIR